MVLTPMCQWSTERATLQVLSDAEIVAEVKNTEVEDSVYKRKLRKKKEEEETPFTTRSYASEKRCLLPHLMQLGN